MDLLQIPISDQHLILAEDLIKNPNRKIISFYAQWFIFLAFQDLLLGKMSQEDFVALGDTFWNLYHNQNNPIFAREALVYWLLHESETYANTYIIVSKYEKTTLEEEIPSLATILKKIKSQIYYM